GGLGGGGGGEGDAVAQCFLRGGGTEAEDGFAFGFERAGGAGQFGTGAGGRRGFAVPAGGGGDGEVGQGGVEREAHAGELGVVGAVVGHGHGEVEGAADDGAGFDGLGHHLQVG